MTIEAPKGMTAEDTTTEEVYARHATVDDKLDVVYVYSLGDTEEWEGLGLEGLPEEQLAEFKAGLSSPSKRLPTLMRRSIDTRRWWLPTATARKCPIPRCSMTGTMTWPRTIRQVKGIEDVVLTRWRNADTFILYLHEKIFLPVP